MEVVRPHPRQATDARFSMAAAMTFELLCVASVVFMICFLIALLRDGKKTSRRHVLHLISPHPESEAAVLRTSNADSRLRLKVIVGGLRPPLPLVR